MAIEATGTYLQIGDGGATESFTTVYEVLDISGPGLTADVVDTSNHSTTGGYASQIPTLLRAGDITFDVNYEPTQATHDATTGLLADYEARTLRNWQLVFPDSGSTTWSFSGYVTAFSISAPVSDKLTASVTISISGQPTLA